MRIGLLFLLAAIVTVVLIPNTIVFAQTAPVVDSTSSVVSITRTTAVCGSYVKTGDTTITERGVVYNTTGNPTLSDSVAASFKVTSAVEYEPSYLTGLKPNTKYYVRAYATNSSGTSYGNEITFTTSAGNAEAIWPLVSDFADTTIGNIIATDLDTSHCSSDVSFNQGPKNNFLYDGDGWLKIPTHSQMTDVFNSNFYLQFTVSPASGQNLNVEGVSFGALGYKTGAVKLAAYYSLNGFATDSSALGPATVGDSVHSILDATADNPISLISANTSITTPMGREWESYSPNITVPDGQTLTVRLYIWGKNGGTIGIKNPVVTGTTSPASSVSLPVVDSTSSVVSITRTTAVCGSYVKTGDTTITERGVVYNTSGNPTVSDSVAASFKVTPAVEYEPSYLTGLKPNTKYYVRAYATNSSGTSYGNEIIFTTSAGNAEAVWPLTPDFAAATVGNINVSDFDTTHCRTDASLNQGPSNNFSWDGDGWLKIPTHSQMTDVFNSNFYLQFTVTPASGQNLNVDGISFGALGYKTHSVKLAAYYSLNGFATDSSALGPVIVADSVHSILDATVDNPIELLSANESITTPMGREWESYSPNIIVKDGETLTVRLYVWGKNGGTVGIKNPIFTGTTSPTSTSSLPVVDSTSIVTSITRTTAVCGSYVKTGDTTITERGVVYNTTGSPTISDSVAASYKVTPAVEYEPSYLTGLKPNTKYYVRAFATSNLGTGYGNEITFTTSSGNAEATWSLLSDLTSSTVGNISASTLDTTHCGYDIAGYNQGPNNSFLWDGDGWLKLPHTSQMTDTMNGNFYLQFTVSPKSGQNFTVEGISFGMLGYKTGSAKVAAYYSMSAFASDTSVLGPATVGDSVHSTLDATIASPISLLSANEKITTPMGREWESYSPNITVKDGQTLTVRLYLWGKNGGTIGIKDLVVTGEAAIASIPVVDSTSIVTSITRTTAVCGSYVKTGDTTITERGVVYNTTGSPTISDGVAASYKVTPAVEYEPSYLDSLKPNTKYYVRAFATNSVGTGYGNEITFTTSAGNAEAIWPLVSGFADTTIGNISATDLDTSHCSSGVSFNQGPKNNFLYDGDGWLKIPTHSQMTDTLNGNFYLQFSVSPKSGQNFTVEGITFGMLGYKTGSVKVAAYYSMSAFASDSSALGSATVGDSVHSTLDATADNPISLLSANPSITTPMGSEYIGFTPNMTIKDGQTLTVRLYIWGKNGGTVGIKNPVVTGTTSAVTSVEKTQIPKSFSVSQNYPNPFNPTTEITYALPHAANVSIKIYNMLGQEVKTLVSGERTAGTYTVQWNGDNDFGAKVSSGAYIYRVVAGNHIVTKKMIMMK